MSTPSRRHRAFVSGEARPCPKGVYSATTDPAKLADASLLDLMKSVDLCVDRMLLLCGQPTRILTNPGGTLRGFGYGRRS